MNISVLENDIAELKRNVERHEETIHGTNGREGLSQNIARISERIKIIMWILGINMTCVIAIVLLLLDKK